MDNQQPVYEAQSIQKKEWYKNWWGVIIAILLFPYFLLYLMWAKTSWNNGAKISITIVFAFFNILAFGFDKDTGKYSSQQTEQKSVTTETKNKASAVQQPQSPIKKIPYEVVLQWSIPNGGKGERIVIDPKYLNFEDMTALGDILKEDLKNERNAFAFVHTDKKSAELQGKMLENPTQAETDYVGKHYVGNYTKNANSKFHEFTIFLNGIDDTSEATNKIIAY